MQPSQVAHKKEFVMAGSSKKSSLPSKLAKSAAPVSSPVRNSAIPKGVGAPVMQIKRDITQADIAKRAYEIFQSGKGGSQLDNWLRAERELKAAQQQQASFR
jgi:Protein of unknown function (DUF2934)